MRGRLIAHRGMHRHAENTLPALAAAARWMDGFECDIRFSRDGVPVVCHDETLTRTHGEQVLVSALSAADLRARGVPTLEAVLRQHRRGRCCMVLDLKQHPARALALASRMARRLEIAPQRIVYLVRDDHAYPLPHGAVYRAREYVFDVCPACPPCTGVACKFDNSRANRQCIENALRAGLEVNLFSLPHLAALAAARYGRACSLTLDVPPPPVTWPRGRRPGPGSPTL